MSESECGTCRMCDAPLDHVGGLFGGTYEPVRDKSFDDYPSGSLALQKGLKAFKSGSKGAKAYLAVIEKAEKYETDTNVNRFLVYQHESASGTGDNRTAGNLKVSVDELEKVKGYVKGLVLKLTKELRGFTDKLDDGKFDKDLTGKASDVKTAVKEARKIYLAPYSSHSKLSSIRDTISEFMKVGSGVFEKAAAATNWWKITTTTLNRWISYINNDQKDKVLEEIPLYDFSNADNIPKSTRDAFQNSAKNAGIGPDVRRLTREAREAKKISWLPTLPHPSD